MLELIGAIDLQKYAGEWLEIARKPAFFQRNCIASKAIYSDLEFKDGKPYKLKVTNTCTKEDGTTSEAVGQAKIITEDYRGLAVSFTIFTDWLNDVNYQVLYLDTDYTQALVGSPDKKYMWILSRQVLSKEEIKRLLGIAKEYGYDISDVIFDKHTQEVENIK